MEISSEYLQLKESLRKAYKESRFDIYLPENYKLNKIMTAHEKTVVDVYTILTFQLKVIEIHAPSLFKEYGINSTGFDFWYDYIFQGNNDEVYKWDDRQLISFLVKYTTYEYNKLKTIKEPFLNKEKSRRPKIRRDLNQIFSQSDKDITHFYDLLKEYKFIDTNNLYILESCPNKFSAPIAGFLKAYHIVGGIKSSYSELQAAFAKEFQLENNRITTQDSPSYFGMKELVENKLRQYKSNL